MKKINDNWYEGKWLYFRLTEHKPRTTKWEVLNRRNYKLGIVEWYAPWRQYIFETVPDNMIFDDGCLQTLSEFLIHLNTLQRKK